MESALRLTVIGLLFGTSLCAHAGEEMQGTLKCKGFLRGVSLNTQIILKKLDTPRNPHNPDFFDVELSFDGSTYSKNTFTEGAGIPVPSQVKMDFFSCTENTHTAGLRLACGGYYGVPGAPVPGGRLVSPVGVSVSVNYFNNGSITANALVVKNEAIKFGAETLYQCESVHSDAALED